MKYLLSPQEYTLPNPRIDGWKKLQEVKARIVDIFIFPLEIFQYYFEHKDLPKEFTDEALAATNKVIAESVSKAALVRRAYVVPGLENPPGPRFLGLTTSEKVVQAVKDLFQFAIDQKYHEVKNSQISGWIEPPSTLLDVEKFEKDPANTLIPYGGYGIFENGNVIIYSVFGINEGVQSLVADRYEVEFRRGKAFINKKEVPQKNLMLCTSKGSSANLFNVPIELQFDQVLSDAEITEVARVVNDLSQKYGPQRIEFSTDENGICFNEVADYWKEAKKDINENINLKGKVSVINNITDFAKLGLASQEDLLSGKIIVKVGESIITNRGYDVLGALAAWKDNLYVLYPGVAATQHAMRVLTDKGHKAFLIGNQKFDEGDLTQIVVSGGKVRVTNLSKTENQDYVSLWDASLLGVELCGGKADRLSKMKILGFQVPHGAVLTTKLSDKILEKLGVKTPIVVADFPKVFQALASPSQEVISLVDFLLADYKQSNKAFSTRSSATIEDGSKDSMAGMFDTHLNVSGNDLVTNSIKVIQSAFSPLIVQHLNNNLGLAEKMKIAVVLQEMVDARCAGVIFGAKAQTGNTDIVEIEANQGLGEAIVSGQAKQVEQYKFSRSERKIIERKGPEILSQPEAKALFMLSERLRQEFNDTPQDIEWAIDQSGQIWVLQSRDLFLGR